MTFSEDLKKAREAKTPSRDVTVLVGDHPYVLRFRKMDGLAWASEVDRNPPRLDAPVDVQLGYNPRTLTPGAARQSGVLVVDGAEVPLLVDEYVPGMSDEQNAARVNEWDDLFAALSGHDFKAITDAIWALNEYEPQQELIAALEQAKKVPARSTKRSA